MTARDAVPPLEQCTDLDDLGAHDVPLHVQTDAVEEAVVDQVAAMDDLAPTGVVAPDGSVLVTRVTEDCAWKLPCGAVETDEAYGEVARSWVEGLTGLDVVLDGCEGVWRLVLTGEATGRTATRHFVVWRASLADSEARPAVPTDAVSAEATPAGAGWFETLPDGAERPPGTDLFVG